MSFAIVAGVGGAVVGGLIAADGSKSAAKTQAQAAQDSNATNKAMFDEQVALQAPFRDTGLAANNRLAFLLGLNPGQSGTTGTPQTLTQGADGVFSPTASIGPAAPAQQAQPAPTVDQAGLQAAVQAEQDRQQLAASGAQQNAQAGKTPEEWAAMVASGQTGVPAQESADAIRARLAPQFTTGANGPTGAPGAQATGNNLNTFGSLAQSFGQADFAADGAPKVPAFDQAVPNAPQLAQFQDGTNLAGFQDMPAFNPDMFKEDPGYQFRLDQGMKGLNNSAAARGGLLSGAALKAADQYNQDYASGEYGNAFNRYQTTRGNKLQDYLTNQNTDQLNRSNSLSDYTTNLGTQQQNYQNQNTAYNTNLNKYSLNRANALQDYSSAFDRFQTNRANVINPLLSLSGVGQQATNQTSNAAQNYGAQSAAAVTGAGNAMAAGQVGSANAFSGALGTAANGFQQNQLMNLMLQRNGGASSTFANSPMSSSLLFSNGSLGD